MLIWSDFQTMEMKDVKAELDSMTVLIRAFRRPSVTSEY